MRRLLIVACASLAHGCVSVGLEGISPGKDSFGVREIFVPVESDEAAESQVPPGWSPNLLVVGTVSAYRKLKGRRLEKFYSSYVEFGEKVHPGAPVAYSPDEFASTFSGWTRLKTFTIPLTWGHYTSSLVPVALQDEIKFPYASGAFLGQEAGDLLVARLNADGYLVVEKVLCKDDSDYFDCAKKFEKGFFDATTGRELNRRTLVPKEKGDWIDPITFFTIKDR